MLDCRMLLKFGPPFRRNIGVPSVAVLLLVLILLPLAAESQINTQTSLTVAPNPAIAGQVVTLTATVTDDGEVSKGTVTFSSGKQVLATVQLVGFGGGGTATLKTRFAPGMYSLTAQYNANKSYQGSNSGPQQLTVTGTEPTMTTLTDQADGNNWDFTASVFGFGFPGPTGTASFTDLTTLVNLGNVGLVGPGMSSFVQPMGSPYATGMGPGEVAIGDFNGDGIADLVVADGANTVSVLLGMGDGSFPTHVEYMAGAAVPYGIAVADFNGDGFADLAVTSFSVPGTVSVLLGNGDGTFKAPKTYTLGNMFVRDVAVADFNGDGFADLAVVDNDGFVIVLLNNGDGTFMQQMQTYGVGAFPNGIAVGDFNGDGVADLAVTNYGLGGVGNTVSVLLGNGDGTFQAQITSGTGVGPESIAVGDFNGDGKADLAVTNFGNQNGSGNTVSVLLGDGTGKFSPAPGSPQAVGSGPFGVAVADINGDGKTDLAVTNVNDSTVSVLLGDGTGNFSSAPGSPYPVGKFPVGIAVADFNGDGVPDVAAINEGTHTASILLGGTVTSGQILNVPVDGSNGPHMIQSAYTPNQGFYTGSLSNIVNVNGNGMLIPTTTGVTSSVNPSALNQPVMFTATVAGSNGGSPTGTVAFSADGMPIAGCGAVQLIPIQNGSEAACVTSTLALGSHTIQATYSGDGNFAPGAGSLVQMVGNIASQTTLSAIPMSPSNYLQLVTFTATVTGSNGGAPTGTVTFTNQGEFPLCVPVQLMLSCSGTCSVATCSTATLPVGGNTVTAAYSGDANYNSSSGSIPYTVNGNIPTTTISMSPPSPVSGQVVTLTATVSNNGDPVTSGTVTFFNSGNGQALGTVQLVEAGGSAGTATLKTRFAPGNYFLGVTFNGTTGNQKSGAELQEFTVTGTEQTITTLTDQPDGNNWDFTASVFGFGFPGIPGPTGTAGFTDLTTQVTLGSVGLAGPGMSSFQPQQAYAAGNAPYAVASGDFNGDGISDLVVTDQTDNTVSVLLGDGTGNFSPAPGSPYMVGSVPGSVAVADFNGDGIADLAVPNFGDATVSVLLGKGDGTFQPQQTYMVGLEPVGVAVGDFNGDGVADLAVANFGDDTVSVLLGNGDGTFQPRQTYATGLAPDGIAVADFSGDGIADLAVANGGAKTVSVLLGKGDGTFQGQQTYMVGFEPVGVAVGDFNGHGIADLAVANLGDNTVSVLLGNGNGTFQGQQTYPVGNTPYIVVVADFNGDGIADLVITNELGNTVSVLLGKGDGTFQAQQTYAVGAKPFGVAVADFNGDGVPDVATANFDANSVSILLGGTVTSGQLKNVPVNGNNGVHMIQSAYTPDQGFYTGSLSNIVNVNGNGSLVPTTTVLTSSMNPSQLNQPVTITALVTSNGGGGPPTGAVNFTDNGAALCTAVALDSDGLAQCTTATLTAGMHAIVGTYSGDQNFSGSAGGLNQVVQSGGKVTPTITLQATPQEINQGNSVLFVATIQSLGGNTPTGTATFVDSGVALATVNLDINGVANYTNTTLAVGQHSVTATYNGDSNFNSVTSAPFTVLVDTPFILQSDSYSGTVSPGGGTQFETYVIAAYRTTPPYVYAAMTCTAPAGTGITCSVACPPLPPGIPELSAPCVLISNSQAATVTVNTSAGSARTISPLRRGDGRALLAVLTGLGGVGLVGIVFIPGEFRRKAAGGILFLVIVILCFGTSCAGNFAAGTLSSPVNNTFYISVNAELREEIGGDPTAFRTLGLQKFWYTLVIK